MCLILSLHPSPQVELLKVSRVYLVFVTKLSSPVIFLLGGIFLLVLKHWGKLIHNFH